MLEELLIGLGGIAIYKWVTIAIALATQPPNQDGHDNCKPLFAPNAEIMLCFLKGNIIKQRPCCIRADQSFRSRTNIIRYYSR